MRLLLSFILFTTHLFAIVESPIHTTISSVDNDKETVTIATPQLVQVGMYGVIVHWFDSTHSIALSWVEVKSIEAETSTLTMIPISSLQQSALPSGKWVPKIGDEVLLGYNYHRALLIAPNPSMYKKVTAYHPERSWVHPDIFATVLSSNGHPTPLIEDFTSTCRANNIGLVTFAFDSSIITVDCQSFKILENKPTTEKIGDIQLPFYSRVSKINANWFGAGSSELKEYSPYYIELLADNNPDNKWIQDYRSAHKEEESNWFGSISDTTEIEVGDDENISADTE